jgi:hypothetical protein
MLLVHRLVMDVKSIAIEAQLQLIRAFDSLMFSSMVDKGFEGITQPEQMLLGRCHMGWHSNKQSATRLRGTVIGLAPICLEAAG